MASRSASLRAAVVGATGYIGMQCVELLAAHPDVDLVALRGRSAAGRRFAEAVPGSVVELVVAEGFDVGDCDVVFAALPHTLAAQHARGWLDAGAVLIDLSADFRLRDGAAYSRWYASEHPAAELCEQAVYGLVELAGEELREAALVAVPGCYPTASLLAALPALRAGLVEAEVIVDAKSGVSGAGRTPSSTVHFAEANESVRAYAVDGHRHGAEMLEQLCAAAGRVSLTFVPHLVPMTRGILATVYLRPRPGVSGDALQGCYRDFCAAHPCLRLSSAPPSTKSVVGSNVAAINCAIQGEICIVTVAIDNLVKGAAGQAVQAMNVRFGLDETAGLPLTSSWP